MRLDEALQQGACRWQLSVDPAEITASHELSLANARVVVCYRTTAPDECPVARRTTEDFTLRG